MKAQLKQILIAVVVLLAAVALLYRWYCWYTRPQAFSHILPVPLESIQSCDVRLEYNGDTASLSYTLSPDQLAQLLDQLSTARYSTPFTNLYGGVTAVQTAIDPFARLYFNVGDKHMELLLSGGAVLVNPLGFQGNSKNYTPDGGQAFQQDVVDFLKTCAPPA